MELLFEAPALPGFGLPGPLRERYGGDLGFSSPRLVANFVSSLDGVVALGAAPPSVISMGSDGDRFVMGLLRACADAVLIGAGTLRAEPNHQWTPEFIFPSEAPAFWALRDGRGRPPQPRLVVMTTRGELDVGARALQDGALVITTAAGAAKLRGRLPAASTLLALSDAEAVDPVVVIDVLRDEGHQLVLTEGGPTLIGALLGAGLLDELFLTLSPVLAGRPGGERRLGLVEGIGFPPGALATASLASVRRDASQLFLRYLLRP